MTNDEAHIIIAKHKAIFMAFRDSTGGDDLLVRWHSAMNSPKLAKLNAQFLEARAALDNPRKVDDADLITQIADNLNE